MFIICKENLTAAEILMDLYYNYGNDEYPDQGKTVDSVHRTRAAAEAALLQRHWQFNHPLKDLGFVIQEINLILKD